MLLLWWYVLLTLRNTPAIRPLPVLAPVGVASDEPVLGAATYGAPP